MLISFMLMQKKSVGRAFQNLLVQVKKTAGILVTSRNVYVPSVRLYMCLQLITQFKSNDWFLYEIQHWVDTSKTVWGLLATQQSIEAREASFRISSIMGSKVRKLKFPGFYLVYQFPSFWCLYY